MRRALATATLTAGLLLGHASLAGAQATTTSDPNDVDSVNNPVDPNDDGGFDDWGLLGLLGLLGLAGLARRKETHPAATTPGAYSSRP